MSIRKIIQGAAASTGVEVPFNGWIATIAGTGAGSSVGDIDYDLIGSVYVTGSITSGTVSPLIVAKLDGYGNIVWQKTFDASYSGQGLSICVTADYNIYVAGATRTNTTNPNAILMKLSNTGSIIWQKELSSSTDNFNKLSIDSAGNVIVAGSVGYDVAVCKFSVDGTLVWNNRYDVGEQGNSAQQLLITSSYIYVGVQANTSGGVLKLNLDGTIANSVVYGISGLSSFKFLISDTGDVILAAADNSYLKVYFISITVSGTVNWQKYASVGYPLPFISTIITDFLGCTYCFYASGRLIKMDTSYQIIYATTFSVNIIAAKTDRTGNLYCIGANSTTGAIVVYKVPMDGSRTGNYTVNGVSYGFASDGVPGFTVSALAITNLTASVRAYSPDSVYYKSGFDQSSYAYDSATGNHYVYTTVLVSTTRTPYLYCYSSSGTAIFGTMYSTTSVGGDYASGIAIIGNYVYTIIWSPNGTNNASSGMYAILVKADKTTGVEAWRQYMYTTDDTSIKPPIGNIYTFKVTNDGKLFVYIMGSKFNAYITLLKIDPTTGSIINSRHIVSGGGSHAVEDGLGNFYIFVNYNAYNRVGVFGLSNTFDTLFGRMFDNYISGNFPKLSPNASGVLFSLQPGLVEGFDASGNYLFGYSGVAYALASNGGNNNILYDYSGLQVVNGRTYVAALCQNPMGFYILDITNITSPITLGYYAAANPMWSVTDVVNNVVSLFDSGGGALVAKLARIQRDTFIDSSGGTRSIQSRPNPTTTTRTYTGGTVSLTDGTRALVYSTSPGLASTLTVSAITPPAAPTQYLQLLDGPLTIVNATLSPTTSTFTTAVNKYY